MTPIRSAVLTCLLIGLAAGCANGVTDPPQGSPDQLLVVVHQPGPEPPYLRTSDIYRIHADGSGAVNLTRSPGVYGGLDLSPDGATLAFHHDRVGNRTDIWLMATNGTNLRRITTDGLNYGPRWSPDGSRIAFLRVYGEDQAIVVIPANGGPPLDLSSAAIEADEPCGGTERRLQMVGWTPDGRVLFSNYICGFGYRHYVVNADGSQPFESDLDFMTTWFSPDGSTIALDDEEAGNRPQLMGLDGSNLRYLTSQPGDLRLLSRKATTQYQADFTPWSPNGNELVIEDHSSGTAMRAAIRVDGSNLRALTPWPADFNGWSPDGTRLAFSRYTGPSSVYIVNADGTGLFDLTENVGDASSAIWLPN